MDNRFTDIICEVEGIVSPQDQRMIALERLIHSQMLEERIDMMVEEVAHDLYASIYEGDDEE